jgi:hypothetical protein
LDKVFIINDETRSKIVAEDPRSTDVIKPFLMGRDIQRYESPKTGRYVISMPKGWTRKMSGDSKNAQNWLAKNYPAIFNYLSPFSEDAAKRDNSNKGDYWWELRSCYYYEEFKKPKIMYNVFQVKPTFTFDNSGFFANHAVWFLPKPDKYLLGILNSKMGWLLISNYCTQIQNGYQLMFKYLGHIPIRTINFADPVDKARHDRMVALVMQMLELNKKLQDAKLDHDKTRLSRQVEAMDASIDKLVYELYGLTEEEIKIVVGTQNAK